jgi:hypothetical protein
MEFHESSVGIAGRWVKRGACLNPKKFFLRFVKLMGKTFY